MAKKIYDLAVKTGTYTANGETKNRYENIGSVMQSDDGSKFLMIKRTFNPAGVPDLSGKGSDSVLIGMFEPKDQQQAAPQQRQQPRQQQNWDDAPF